MTLPEHTTSDEPEMIFEEHTWPWRSDRILNIWPCQKLRQGLTRARDDKSGIFLQIHYGITDITKKFVWWNMDEPKRKPAEN